MNDFQEAGALTDFGFSGYETACYMSLVAHHPANGSQLSKLSGIARSRIYDVLRSLVKKGMVFEIEQGMYVPLPPEELMKRLRGRFESNLKDLETELESAAKEPNYDYLLNITGRNNILTKAADMIDHARFEIYIRLFPTDEQRLDRHMKKAAERGVGIRFISMGQTPLKHEIQVIHPSVEGLEKKIGGRSFDLIVDKREVLAGILEDADGESSVIWTRNRWFVIASRDSLRHDFYHYFLHKTQDRKEPLNAHDRMIHELIKADD